MKERYHIQITDKVTKKTIAFVSNHLNVETHREIQQVYLEAGKGAEQVDCGLARVNLDMLWPKSLTVVKRKNKNVKSKSNKRKR